MSIKKRGARVSVQKVFESVSISDETYDVVGQRIHRELLRYTVPVANGKQSTNVGTEWFCVNNLKRQLRWLCWAIVRNVKCRWITDPLRATAIHCIES